ncbi:MAG: hypothetical protein PWP24_537 [Clostridiales bacterium]|nr:hypothetical protein [Clostridiales bacterium]
MRKILITGGTVFVSRYVAEYFVQRGDEVYVLNRNHAPQSDGVILVEADRNMLGDCLRKYAFDAILDMTAYTGRDVQNLLDAVGAFQDYILLSSSAVYQETSEQPFHEDLELGENKYWGAYGTDKIEAEAVLQRQVPNAYILRPPYLYGPMNNIYREAFVFECARRKRMFYHPKDGEMKLQFFHIQDLCRILEALLEKRPPYSVINVGNEAMISVKEWVKLCYQVAGEEVKFQHVYEKIEQRQYFCFYDYEYCLDVSRQKELLLQTKDIKEGLRESFAWYQENSNRVITKPFLSFIDHNF